MAKKQSMKTRGSIGVAPAVPRNLQPKSGPGRDKTAEESEEVSTPKLEIGPTTGPVLEPGMPRTSAAELLKAPATPAAVARPAMVGSVPATVKLHWTQLFPDLMAERIDPLTGSPLPPRARIGGQFSGRMLILVNKVNDTSRRVAVLTSIEPSNWPVKNYERVADPQQYPNDAKHCQGQTGNVEIIFDFTDERDTWFAAMGTSTKYDPLALNDVPAGQAPPESILKSRISQG